MGQAYGIPEWVRGPSGTGSVFVPAPTPVLKPWPSWRRPVLDGQDPVSAQRRTLARLLRCGRRTDFGRAHGFASIRSVEDYRSFDGQVP